MRYGRYLPVLALLVSLPVQAAPSDAPKDAPAQPAEGRKEAVGLIDESQRTLSRGQDVLRFASVKLAGLVTDNLKFRKLDRELENARQEFYPALNACEKLKSRPQNLREMVRLYVGLRLLEERLNLVSAHFSLIESPAARPLSVQIMDLSNKVGRLALKLHPLVYKVIDAYQAAAPNTQVEINLKWVDEDIQGPEI